MLITDLDVIGENFYAIRKRLGLSRSEVAESAGLSDRTYADIERGSVNMRMKTFLQICKVLHVTPNDILVNDNISLINKQSELLERMNLCTPDEQKTILQILAVYLNSLNR